MVYWKEAVKRGNVITCKDLINAKRLMTKLNDRGFKLFDGGQYDPEDTAWNDAKENTYYNVALGTYGNLIYQNAVISRKPYIVIPFEDINWSEDESERYVKHMKEEILKAYCRIRTIDNTIPDDVLDFMKDASLKALENNTKLEVPNEF